MSDARSRAVAEPAIVRRALMGVAILYLFALLVLPLGFVFREAFSDGIAAYLRAIADPETRSALGLTAIATGIAVPLNVVFGLSAAWAIARFRFRFRTTLITLIDLPFAVSPVISGLIYVLAFGTRGVFGPFLAAHGIRVIFAIPGIVLATVFVTSPFVARELIPFLEAQGFDEEEAAYVLGASGLTTFFRITLPKAKWGLLYGVILCTARAIGEFGAVSVVSGHVRGRTDTLPLQVEVLYNEYDFSAAFAVASLLTLLAGVTLIAKRVVESRAAKDNLPVPELTPGTPLAVGGVAP